MRWYKKMYLGENARKKKYRIIAKTNTRRLQHEVYLISLSHTPGNILEMFSANVLLQPYYRKARSELLVLGAACGYDEGLDVMAKILDDTYRDRGDFDVAKFLGC